MKAKRRSKPTDPATPPVRSGIDHLQHYGESLSAAVQWMLSHLDHEPDPVKREALGRAITVGHFEAIAAIYAPDWRPHRSKERQLVEEMTRYVYWHGLPVDAVPSDPGGDASHPTAGTGMADATIVSPGGDSAR